MTSLNTNSRQGSGQNGKWRGGTALFTAIFLMLFGFGSGSSRPLLKCYRFFLPRVLLTAVSLSACQLPGQHMEPPCTMINCGFLLVMMEMPGMWEFLSHHLLLVFFPNWPIASCSCRLNDMWTISLQDREHACWEEASTKICHKNTPGRLVNTEPRPAVHSPC